MTKNRQNDIDTLEEAKPFIRSVLAFLLYARCADGVNTLTLAACYVKADEFINQLEADLKD